MLIFKGYSGDLALGGGLSAISGMIGMLNNRSGAPKIDQPVGGTETK